MVTSWSLKDFGKRTGIKQGFEKIKPALEIAYFKYVMDAPNYKGALFESNFFQIL
jgi:hypothetical protein